MSTPSLVNLDCTLRDGGFYTSWHYDRPLVEAYLRAMDRAGVDYAEVGYRSTKQDGFAGPYKYCAERLLDALPTLERTKLALMIDAKELVGNEGRLGSMFSRADESRVALVRVASHVADLDSAVEQAHRLSGLGYRVGLNLMAASALERGQLDQACAKMAGSSADVLYLADSYGSLLPAHVRAWSEVLGPAERAWGVHLHNNLELAFANALEATRLGATWIDTSVLGMGRGPGNLKTELWLQHAQRTWAERLDPGAVYDFISSHLQRLHDSYRWGPAPAYALSGHLGVHPSYAQALLESGRYSTREVLAILRRLHSEGAGSAYSSRALSEAIVSRFERTETPQLQSSASAEWLGPQGLAGKEVLVLGRGPSLYTHAAAINEYIERVQPVVLECNHSPQIAAAREHIAGYLVVANAEASAQAAFDAGKRLWFGFPKARLEPILSSAAVAAVRELAYVPSNDRLSFEGGAVTIPADDVAMFLIAHAVLEGATRFTLAGFDGYASAQTGRERRMQSEMTSFFRQLSELRPEIEATSILPNGYSLPVRSVYALLGSRLAEAPKQ